MVPVRISVDKRYLSIHRMQCMQTTHTYLVERTTYNGVRRLLWTRPHTMFLPIPQLPEPQNMATNRKRCPDPNRIRTRFARCLKNAVPFARQPLSLLRAAKHA